MKLNQADQLSLILAEKEGQKVEFKEAPGRLDREMVAFANATGGSIFLGVDDDGQIVSFKTTNELRSRIQDIAHSCNPAVSISVSLRFPRDFDGAKLKRFLSLAGIEHKARSERILTSLDMAEFHGKNLRLRQAGVLFFAKEPQRLLKESYITCVRYEGTDRFDILDRVDVYGDLISMIEETHALARNRSF